MKFARFPQVLALLSVLALAASGCKTHHPKPLLGGENSGGLTGTNPNPGPGTAVPGAGTEGVNAQNAGIASNPAGAHDGWTPDATVFQGDTVHFAYDSSVVQPEDKSKISAVADYLKSNPSTAVRIEGHCDERGTEEYNRALGDRRAQTLREELVALGIDATRVDTISYGKDRPEDPGHDQAAWAKNRRGVFILLTPPK